MKPCKDGSLTGRDKLSKVQNLVFCWGILFLLSTKKLFVCKYIFSNRNKQPVTYMTSMCNLHIVNQMIIGWSKLHFFLHDVYCMILLDALRNLTHENFYKWSLRLRYKRRIDAKRRVARRRRDREQKCGKNGPVTTWDSFETSGNYILYQLYQLVRYVLSITMWH